MSSNYTTAQHKKNNIPTTELCGNCTGGIVIFSLVPLEITHAHVLQGAYSRRSPLQKKTTANKNP